MEDGRLDAPVRVSDLLRVHPAREEQNQRREAHEQQP